MHYIKTAYFMDLIQILITASSGVSGQWDALLSPVLQSCRLHWSVYGMKCHAKTAARPRNYLH